MNYVSRRDFFAANAPEKIPNWFSVKEAPLPPKRPVDWWEATNIEKDANLLRDWLADGCCDLPEHLSWYQEICEKYNIEKREYDIRMEMLRYFEWRKFFAEQMEVII